MSIFILIFLATPILSGLWWWWAHRRLKNLGVHRGWHLVLATGMSIILAGFLMILSRIAMQPGAVMAHINALTLLWALLFLPGIALPSLVLWSLTKGVLKFKERRQMEQPCIPSLETEPLEQPNISRRQILGAIAVIFPMLATYGTTAFGMQQIKHFRVRKLTVTLRDLPAALDGMTIAHLTDTHVGKFTRGPILKQFADSINAMQADIVVFTGDLIDNSNSSLTEALGMLKQIDHRSGLFVIEGNHDLIDDATVFRNQMAAHGFPLLLNEGAIATVRGVPVQILGIRWDRHDPDLFRYVDATVAKRQAGIFPILLAHHPHAFDRAAEKGIPLTLAGHTHGGQLMLTDHFGAGPLMFRYWSGLYRKGNSALVVSNGAGSWFPIRTHAPAEIIHLTLRKG